MVAPQLSAHYFHIIKLKRIYMNLTRLFSDDLPPNSSLNQNNSMTLSGKNFEGCSQGASISSSFPLSTSCQNVVRILECWKQKTWLFCSVQMMWTLRKRPSLLHALLQGRFQMALKRDSACTKLYNPIHYEFLLLHLGLCLSVLCFVLNYKCQGNHELKLKVAFFF